MTIGGGGVGYKSFQKLVSTHSVLEPDSLFVQGYFSSFGSVVVRDLKAPFSHFCLPEGRGKVRGGCHSFSRIVPLTLAHGYQFSSFQVRSDTAWD